MTTSAVVPQEDFLQGVERLDVVEQIGLRFGPRAVAGAMHPLIFQTVEEALGRRVVPAVALAAHRTDHPVGFQPRLKGVACILASSVGVMDQARCRFFVEPGHGHPSSTARSASH